MVLEWGSETFGASVSFGEDAFRRPRLRGGMGDGDDIADRLRRSLRSAGKRYAEVQNAFRSGQSKGRLPAEEDGRRRIVCRRYAEKRAVHVDEQGRPECFDEEHPDCRGCAEDVREGCVQTW